MARATMRSRLARRHRRHLRDLAEISLARIIARRLWRHHDPVSDQWDAWMATSAAHAREAI